MFPSRDVMGFRYLGLSRNRDACFVVIDSAGQKLAYIYYENEPGRRAAAELLMVVILYPQSSFK
jgi:hypothetical protein